ncbi:MAG TPA: hypothetical protein VIL20_00705 [Sandaracinaceae bacterium]
MVTRVPTLCLLLLAACDARPVELSVDVRTDLAPVTDFASVRVELHPGQGRTFDPVTRPARSADRFFDGVRVADFTGVPLGASRVRAALLDAAGDEVLARNVDLTIDGDYALTVVLSASCVGRSCPGAGEPASHTECVSGECVDPRCGGPDPEGCGDVSCATPADCALDCVAACIAGACVCIGSREDAGSPGPTDAGPRDAGPCPGECTPGETDEETRPCGECNEGVERRVRTCGDDCRWGAFSAWSACETSAQCSPGQTERESRACGNCGTQSRSRTCDPSTCTWGAWTAYGDCTGEGVCTPGATRAGSCDGCSHQVCTSSCTWSACQLRPGNQCDWERGTNWRCCGSNRWQYCLSSCRWSTDCEPCTGCGC